MKVDENIIQKYVDGRLSEAERFELEKKVELDPDLKKRIIAYKIIDQSMQEAISESKVSLDFTNLVVGNLHKTMPVKQSFWTRSRILILAVVVICIVAGFTLLLGNFNFQNLLPEITANNPVDKNLTLQVDPNQIFDKDIFFKVMIYFNAILGLLLLDRAIFRPLFRERRRVAGI